MHVTSHFHRIFIGMPLSVTELLWTHISKTSEHLRTQRLQYEKMLAYD